MSKITGTFVLSLDTELAWGMFDIDRVREFESAYRKTRHVVNNLCELFDKYQIPATWALVSHLLVNCVNETDHLKRTETNFDWVNDWFGQLPCHRGLDHELWYAPWLGNRIRTCETSQEVGLHGSTHMPLGASGCSKQNAEEEIKVAVDTLQNAGFEPDSFIFPRNSIEYTELLPEYDIKVYRSNDARWYEHSRFTNKAKSILRFGDELTRRTPPVVKPTAHQDVVEIPGSQVFRPTHWGWKFIPPSNSVYRAQKGLKQAAETGNVFHLWFHPFNLGHSPQRDLDRLEDILSEARLLVKKGKIKCRSMREVGLLARQGWWNEG